MRRARNSGQKSALLSPRGSDKDFPPRLAAAARRAETSDRDRRRDRHQHRGLGTEDKLGQIITLAQRKGGVGKTTLAVAVAAELSRRGKDCALVDSDPQRSGSEWAKLGNLAFPVYEIILGEEPVGAWVAEVRRVEADYVVIDTAPNDRALGASIAVSDLILIPCTPSGLDLEATVRTLEIIDNVRARRRERVHVVLVPNRVDQRTLEGQQLADELIAFGEPVAVAIGDRSAFVRAFAKGQSVGDLAPGQSADREIRSLCDLVEYSLAHTRD
jgi:chromosome partitioning protein